MPTDKIARLRELQKKAVGSYSDSEEFEAAQYRAWPHLLAIAEAAKELKREDETPVRDLTMIRTRTKQLYEALTAFEEAP